ncbi:MAG: NAD(+) synthase [Acidobacteria bacterium]|nr:NAD(+) synthase [Acidobacteriota bacterium]
MAILFDLSVKENALVLGTGNKSEILLGYTTWYGDSASSLNPLGDLYKQQVYQLARFLRIPNNIIKKAPSADLWANQTDEGEMGVKYKVADAVLYLIFDEKKSPEQVSKILSLKMELISKILQRVKNNEFKRKLPPILKISR